MKGITKCKECGKDIVLDNSEYKGQGKHFNGEISDIRIYLYNEKGIFKPKESQPQEIKMKKYIHKEFRIWLFRLSFARLGKNFTIRFEISTDWD